MRGVFKPPLDSAESYLADELGSWGFLPGIDISKDGSLFIVRGDGSQACSTYNFDKGRMESFLTLDKLIASGIDADAESGGGGVQSMAIAPGSNVDVTFAWSGSLWRSMDGLKSFNKMLPGVLMNGNDDFRGFGPRFARDPRNSEVFAFGSQLQGLKISRTGGQTWEHISNEALFFGTTIDMSPGEPTGDTNRVTVNGWTWPDGHIGPVSSGGITGVIYDPTSPTIMVDDVRCTSGMYATVFGDGVYRSDDAGRTWTLISPANVNTIRKFIRLQSGALLMLAGISSMNYGAPSVRRWVPGTTQWKNIVMPTADVIRRSLAEDPFNPGRVAIMGSGSGQKLTVSTDDGLTFGHPTGRSYDSTGDILGLAAVYNQGAFMTVGDVLFDPTVKNRLWLSEGVGLWYYDMPDGKPSDDATVLWHSHSEGISQLVANCIVCTNGKFIEGSYDRSTMMWPGPGGGYTSIPMPDTDFGSTWDLAVSPFDSNYVVAATANHQNAQSKIESDARSGYSTDGGNSFTRWPTFPTEKSDIGHPFAYGAVAVSTPGNVVRIPAYRGRPYYTVDGGQNWVPVTLPGDWQTNRPAPTDKDPNKTESDYGKLNLRSESDLHHTVCADSVQRDKFYMYVPTAANDPQSGLYVSTDKGVTWVKIRGAMDDSANWVYSSNFECAPGKSGHLWATQGRFSSEGTVSKVTGFPVGKDFIRSTDGGVTWSVVPGLKTVTCFAFGKGLPNSTYPAIYAVGYLNHVYGIYVTYDEGNTWQYLTRYPGKKIQVIKCIAADMDNFGIFMTGHTSGYAWGRPSWRNLG